MIKLQNSTRLVEISCCTKCVFKCELCCGHLWLFLVCLFFILAKESEELNQSRGHSVIVIELSHVFNHASFSVYRWSYIYASKNISQVTILAQTFFF